MKDMAQQQEEDQKNLQHSKDQIDRLNKKIKATKNNQEEAVRTLLFSRVVFSPFYACVARATRVSKLWERSLRRS